MNTFKNNRKAKIGDPCRMKGPEGEIIKARVMQPDPKKAEFRAVGTSPRGTFSDQVKDFLHVDDFDPAAQG